MNETNPSNAVTILYGISGTGKSRQIDEAAEYVWETHKKVTRVYVSDLGGWGTKRLSLIRLGIVQVWYFVSHLDPWVTAEQASLGYWPESFLEVQTGMTAPDVRLIAPRSVKWVMRCPQGHVAFESRSQEALGAWTGPCQECQVQTSAANCLGIDKVVLRSAGFNRIGLYAYDSLTQLNEAGMEAAAEKGAGLQEGEALRSPAALREGEMTFGLNAKTHYGFLQQRSRGWIRNIRTIPDQVERAIITCGVEMGKGDDESGGIPIYGPKIAGNARTSSVPGWAGNCLHLSKDTLADGNARHRIWLVNHTDPRDPRAIPYLAKHRGDPGGMPQFLEDAPGEVPFTTCTLKKFYQLEKAQLASILQQDAEKFTDAPGLMSSNEEEVISTSSAAPSLAPFVSASVSRGDSRRQGLPIQAAGTSATPSLAVGSPVGPPGPDAAPASAVPAIRRVRR